MSQTILISSARSGTNYLLDVYQKCFPNDIVLKEIFRKNGDSISLLQEILSLSEEAIFRLKDEDPAQLWRLLRNAKELKGVSMIAKVFYYHKLESDVLWDHFRSTSTVIHLIRGNIFNSYISGKLALTTGQWQLRGEAQASNDKPTFVVDRDEYINFAKKRNMQIGWVRKKFGKDDYHEIMYEDIATSSDKCANSLGIIYGQDFSESSMIVGIRKQKDRANSDIVLNYDEVADLDCRVH